MISVIARSRFELLSQGPEPRMIDLYTIGLRASIFFSLVVYNSAVHRYLFSEIFASSYWRDTGLPRAGLFVHHYWWYWVDRSGIFRHQGF